MAKSPRQTMKQSLNRAIRSIDLAQNQVATTGQEYKEKYPDVYELYCEVIQLLEGSKIRLQELLKAI